MQNQPSPDHQHADLIIKAGWIAPVAPETGALADHALVVYEAANLATHMAARHACTLHLTVRTICADLSSHL